MSFSEPEIETMLREYEDDHHTGMDIGAAASHLHYYTGGYPFLVSRLCKTIDERPLEWTMEGVNQAERMLVYESNTLFDDLIKNIERHPDFAGILCGMLLEGRTYSFNIYTPNIGLGAMYGILESNDGTIDNGGRARVANVIFETVIYNHFISLDEQYDDLAEQIGDSTQFVHGGTLDMDRVTERFAAFMKSEYRDEDGRFIERQARLLFLSFLKPIINGAGHYVVEPETRDNRRMDIVVFFGKEKYIIELKIWRGDAYEEKGMEQLAGYLRAQEQTRGWLVSFADNIKAPREGGAFEQSGVTIIETVVAYRDKI
jgi:hypothetical protein